MTRCAHDQENSGLIRSGSSAWYEIVRHHSSEICIRDFLGGDEVLVVGIRKVTFNDRHLCVRKRRCQNGALGYLRWRLAISMAFDPALSIRKEGRWRVAMTLTALCERCWPPRLCFGREGSRAPIILIIFFRSSSIQSGNVYFTSLKLHKIAPLQWPFKSLYGKALGHNETARVEIA